MSIRTMHSQLDEQHQTAISGGWQIIYTGFILIMLSFFILLTSFTSLQESRITRFARSFSTQVSVFQKGKSVLKDSVQNSGDLSLLSREDRVARLFEKIRTLEAVHELDRIDIKTSDRGVVMTLSETMLFASGEAQLSNQALPLLARIGEIISQVGVPVEIEGHTDARPIQNHKYRSNWYLSSARAVNVLRFLIDNVNLDSKLISAAGRSEYHPLFPNDSLEHMAANRRVEFIFGVD